MYTLIMLSTANTLPSPRNLPVETAIKPLSPRFWNEETASHLLRRIGFSATPNAVRNATRKSCEKVLEAAFGTNYESFPVHPKIQEYRNTANQRYKEITLGNAEDREKRRLRQKIRNEERKLFNKYAVDWLVYARQPENSAREKFVLFLQDVFVVQRQTVKQTPLLIQLQEILRKGIAGEYPDLCKAVSREPAMIYYLDLDKNKNNKPNENFARELFELFTLGEGNYSEADIKEAARAFTGYRVKNRFEFHRAIHQFDRQMKTVFNRSGNWDGDDVIDITFQQPAARTFLVRELLKFYVTDQAVDEAYVEAFGEAWANHNFNLSYLIQSIFSSTLFYHPAFRGNSVKSPIHFYIGLCQDLHLDVIPFEAKLIQSLRAMGQNFYNPPNVRGWLYGQNWINSTTISARRQVVDYLFTPLDEERLNGNDQRTLQQVQASGRDNFLVTDKRLQQVLEVPAEELAGHFAKYFITAPSRSGYLPVLESVLSDRSHSNPTEAVRNAMIALLQSPAYNLC